MKSPLVSIITPCHNDAHFIHRPLESVINQPYQNYEMIIVDDGSKDPETLRILENIKHPKVTIIHQKNKGLPCARNSGIRIAKGGYILPLDSDDKITPICLTKSVEILENNPKTAMVYGNYETSGCENRLVLTGKFNPYRLLFNNHLAVCSMFRKTAWEQVGGYTEEMMGFEDWEFWIKLMKAGWKFEKVDEVMFYYHKHEGSMWTQDKSKYKKLIAQIRGLHSDLYERETLQKLKRNNNVTWFENLVYHVPLLVRYRVGRSFLRPLMKYINRMGLYRDT